MGIIKPGDGQILQDKAGKSFTISAAGQIELVTETRTVNYEIDKTTAGVVGAQTDYPGFEGYLVQTNKAGDRYAYKPTPSGYPWTGPIQAPGPIPTPGGLTAGLMMGLAFERSELGKFSKTDLVYFKAEGLDHIRITHGRDNAAWPDTLDMSKFGVWTLADSTHGAGLVINLDPLFESGAGGYAFTDKVGQARSAFWLVQFAMEGQKRYADDFALSIRNEPYDPNWNLVRDVLQQRIDALRKAGFKGRIVVSDWGIANMTGWVTDPLNRLLMDGHCYAPGSFTRGHKEPQGPLPADHQAQFAAELDSRLAWAKKYNAPLYVGEYGCANTSSQSDRAKYLAGCITEMNKRGLSRCYWEANKMFGLMPLAGPMKIPPALTAALGLK